jgi:hypothetical protein
MTSCLPRSQEKLSPRKMGLFPRGMIGPFSKWQFWKKRMGDHPWKEPRFIGPEFFCKRNRQPTFEFHMKMGILLNYWMVPKMLSLNEWATNFWGPESVAVFGLGAVFSGACNIYTLPFWNLLIDIHSILFHVEFEGGLSLSVLKTRATCYQNMHLRTVKFLKKKGPPFISTPAIFKFCIRQ